MNVDTGEIRMLLEKEKPEPNEVIVNPKLVPREYCVPSESLLRAGFKLTDTIPGAHKVPKNIYQTRVRR